MPVKTFWWTMGILLVTDVTSFAASLDLRATTIITVAVVVVAGFLSWRRPEIALLVVIAELVHGSQGHLFEIHLGGIEIPIRILLFIAFLTGWFFQSTPAGLTLSRWLTALAAAVFLGVVVGVARGNSLAAVFQDADAYGFILLIFPATDLMRRAAGAYREQVIAVITAAATATSILTLTAHVVYRVDPGWLRHFYVWIRDWGLGEVTPSGPAAFHRVFFQSHLWVLIAWLILLARRGHDVVHNSTIGVLFAALFLSFSRSLWLGGVVGLVALLITQRRAALRTLAVAAPIAIVVIVLITPTIFGRTVARVASTATEPAASSRWNLLPVLSRGILAHPILGSGFGSTLTYTTKDPKLIAEFGSDQYTTAAFEWGYLEQWFKMGIFGLVAVIGLLISIGKKIRNIPDAALRAGLVAGLLALVVVHVTSPYLNHPLGLGFLVLGAVLAERSAGVPA